MVGPRRRIPVGTLGACAMRVAVGSDHAGFEPQGVLAAHLADAGHEVVDLGTDSRRRPVDYPDFGAAVGRAVADGRAELGVCVCGTGIGIGIAANKVAGRPGRRGPRRDHRQPGPAAQRRQRRLPGGRTTGRTEAIDAVDAFFSTEFEGGRHQHRLDEIAEIEADAAPRAPRSRPPSTLKRRSEP